MSTLPPPPPSVPPAPLFDDRLTFPPFPTPPPGVTITPFTDFKEYGIQMFPTGSLGKDDVERDGLGIPTVELRVKHDTDNCKTETKRKRKHPRKNHTSATELGKTPGAPKTWWELWMENEDLKGGGPYDPHTSALDRFYEVAADFRKTRSWPQGPNGIAANWDQFRLYVGLLSNTPIWTRTDKPQEEDEDTDGVDEEEEFENDGTKNVAVGPPQGPRKFAPRARARPPYALYGAEPVPIGSDEEVKTLLNGENARREEEMVDFLNDPALKLKIFFSSYMRKQGLIWADRNLINMPQLVGFFIRFMIRNRAFPETEFDRDLQRSLEVVDLAQKELILTSKVAKQIPDDFHRACKNIWGQKADGFKPVDIPLDIEEKSPAKEADSGKSNDTTDTKEPETKRAKLDSGWGSGDTAPTGWGSKGGEALKAKWDDDDVVTAADKFEKDLIANNVQVIKVNEDEIMKDAEKITAIRDNLNPDIDALPAWGKADDWLKDNADTAFNSWAAPAIIDWAPPVQYTVFPYLGPTAFPLTHTSGIVERSVRRIKSFTPPPAPATIPKSPVTDAVDADAVDVELGRNLAKVVLAPWAGWDKYSDEMPHLAEPRILETSRGLVHGTVGEDGKVVSPGEGVAQEVSPEGVRPHDPFNDDITVLVDPAVIPILSQGLGFGGTWVQIAREQDFSGEKKKKKKGKSKKGPNTMRYWYIEELVLTLPSFHT